MRKPHNRLGVGPTTSVVSPRSRQAQTAELSALAYNIRAESAGHAPVNSPMSGRREPFRYYRYYGLDKSEEPSRTIAGSAPRLDKRCLGQGSFAEPHRISLNPIALVSDTAVPRDTPSHRRVEGQANPEFIAHGSVLLFALNCIACHGECWPCGIYKSWS